MTSLRPAPAGYGELVGSSHGVRVKVDAWRAGKLLAEDVPLLDGQLVERGDQSVPETVTLAVPAFDPATSTRWDPSGDPFAPLNKNGQRLRLTYLVPRGSAAGADTTLAVPLGWLRIEEWTTDGYTVELECAGLGAVLAGARLLAPTSPPAGSTLAGEIRRLVDGRLPLLVDPVLVDRAAPSSLAWQDDRLGALYELADAWPAELRVDENGTLRVEPADDDAAAADLELVEDDGARELAPWELPTVLSSRDAGARGGVPNIVVTRGENAGDPNRAPVTGYWSITDPAHPLHPAGYGDEVEFFASPLLATQAQADAAARTIGERKSRRGRTIPVSTAPDARIRPRSRVDFRRASGEVVRCRVVDSTLPLVAAGGAQTVILGEL